MLLGSQYPLSMIAGHGTAPFALLRGGRRGTRHHQGGGPAECVATAARNDLRTSGQSDCCGGTRPGNRLFSHHGNHAPQPGIGSSLSHCHRQPLRCISGILCAAEQETIRSRHSSRPSVQFQEKLTTRVITADKGRRRIGVWRPASQHLCRRALAKIVFCTKANFHFRLRSA